MVDKLQTDRSVMDGHDLKKIKKRGRVRKRT
jgi:hypothetical protein